jgi:hypothetical protein
MSANEIIGGVQVLVGVATLIVALKTLLKINNFERQQQHSRVH